MSNDPENRDLPPDFDDDDDDDTKDEDQMFKSARLPVTDNVPLSEDDDDDDDDDENPFSEPAVEKKNSAKFTEASTNDAAAFTISPVVQELESTTVTKQETKSFPSNPSSNLAEANIPVAEPVASTVSFESELSPTGLVSKHAANEIADVTANTKLASKQSDQHDIEITVSDPTKVGEVCLLSLMSRITNLLF